MYNGTGRETGLCDLLLVDRVYGLYSDHMRTIQAASLYTTTLLLIVLRTAGTASITRLPSLIFPPKGCDLRFLAFRIKEFEDRGPGS